MTSFSSDLYILREIKNPQADFGYELFTDIELRISRGSYRPYLAMYEPLTQRMAYLSLVIYPQLITLLELDRLEGLIIDRNLPIRITHTQVIISGSWKEHPMYSQDEIPSNEIHWMWLFHPRVVIEVRRG